MKDGETTTFATETRQAGQLALGYEEGKGMTLDQKHWTKNYVFIPPVEVNSDYNYMNGVVGFVPSPDWFTGFYLFDTIDEYDRTFFNRFLLHTYPWDAGTDGGDTYTATDVDLDPPVIVSRIFPNNAPGPNKNLFVSPVDGLVKPTGEFECRLHVCPIENPECLKENWPPENGCDVYRFAGCDKTCDPLNATETSPCQACVKDENDDVVKYYPNCCRSNMIPKGGNCEEELAPKSSAFAMSGNYWRSSIMVLVISASALLFM
jgi:Spondin_N